MPKFQPPKAFPHVSLPKEVRRFKVGQAQEVITSYFRVAMTDRLIWLFISLWFLPIVMATSFTILNLSSLPMEVPLFYSRPWGESQLATKAYLFVPLAGTFLLGITDLGISLNLHPKNRILSYFLAGAASVVALLAAITIINIVNLMR